MNRSGYVKIMSALIRLMVTIMVEAGKVPIASAEKVGANVMKAITGRSEDDKK
jgi:hypothetical protein